MLIKAIIIDDERLARSELKKLLQEFPVIEVIDEAANASEGIEKIRILFFSIYRCRVKQALICLQNLKKRRT